MMSKYNELKSFQTPAFIYLEPELHRMAEPVFDGCTAAGVKLLFPLK